MLARTLPCYSLARPVQQIDCPIAPKPLLEAVLVEGHTDDVPISTPQFEDNWQLAPTRAVNTYKALLDFQHSLGWLRNARGEDPAGGQRLRGAPAGLAGADARRNRRIDLRFLIAAPSEVELNTIRQEVAR